MRPLNLPAIFTLPLILAMLSCVSGCAELELAHRSQVSGDELQNQLKRASGESAEDWITSYYQKKQPDQLITRAIGGYIFVAEKKQSPRPITAFVSEVFCENPSYLKKWVDQFRVTPQFTRQFAEALWMCPSPEAADAMRFLIDSVRPDQRAAIEALTKATPPNLKSFPLREATVQQSLANLDAMWAAFFATGQDWPVLRIIDVATTPPMHSESDSIAVSMQNAAQWSLGANSKQHQRVRDIIEKTLPTLPPERMALLRQIMNDRSGR